MKRKNMLAGLALAIGLSVAINSQAQACDPTGFYVDGMNMTAALINPGDVAGIDVNATGCNIGIYYDDGTDGGTVVGGTVNGASIGSTASEEPNYFGILVNGGGGSFPVVVNVTHTTIKNVGENQLNGAQHGNAIFYINGSTNTALDDSRNCSAISTASTTGIIAGNTISGYQKNGIVAKCPGVSVTISGNTVTGAGAGSGVNFIAQNGIEVGLGALGTVSGNQVLYNQYSGTNNADASGVLVFGGAGNGGPLTLNAQVVNNTLTNNDVGVFSINCTDVNCTVAPTMPTNSKIMGNTLINSAVTNKSGCGYPNGYQAGVSDLGRNDKISKNVISGTGYQPLGTTCESGPVVLPIDTSGSKGAKQHHNIVP